MPGRIVQTDVDEVKSRTNIADIVGERVALKPAGVGSLKGLCPFHDERSPSFHVRPQHGFYHCFGCGASGDVYTFLREMDHLSFTESVERLAGRLGYALHYEDGGPAVETSGRTRLYAAGAAAAMYFREQLQSAEAETAHAFLGGRGFDAGAAAHFGVGYAPKGWGNLQQALRAKGFSDEELLTAGLLSQGQRGVYDRFRGRVVWPIRDVTGQVVGFGARKLYDDDQGPKYLNTPETPIYRKSQVLYGLDLAKKDISRSRQVVVVEGYTDVMACHLAGITTAVATCGTAFGSEHITALRRVMGDDSAHGEVVFTFDPDDAGVGAAMRAFADEKRFAAQTYVAVAPPGLDPCDLRLARGDGAVRAIIESKVPMFEFAIDQRIRGFDLGTVEGRAGALRAGAPIVAGIRDPSLQPGYVKVLARRLGLELGEVSGAVRRASRSVGAQREQEDIPHSAETPSELRITLQTLPTTADAALERDALMGFLQYGHLIDGELVRRALDTTFTVPGLDAVRGVVAAMPDYSHPGWAAAAVQAVREPYRSLAAELLTGTFPARDALHAQLSAQDLARRLSLRTLDRTKSELLGAMQRVQADSEEGRAVRLRLRDLDVERQRLLDAG